MGLRRKPPAPGRRNPFVIGIVGRSSFYRQSLVHRIGQVSVFLPIDLGSDHPDSISRARDHDLDLVLIDLLRDDACRFSKELLERVPRTRTVAILDECTESDLRHYAEAGFSRLICIEASFEELIGELMQTLREEMDPGARLERLTQVRQQGWSRTSGSPLGAASLSRREYQVLHLMARHLSNKEIASELGIETGTVKNHVHHILHKLQLQSRWEVVKAPK
jgi:DNA-binding NarL/FixJ family response regulator